MIEIEPDADWTPEADQEATRFRQLIMMNASLKGWTDTDAASRAGYRPMDLDENHWFNSDFLHDGRVFDPTRPEFLVIAQGRVLGAMFLPGTNHLDQPDPLGAPLLKWHYHEYNRELCFDGPIAVGPAAPDGSCPADQRHSRVSPPMVHVWFVDLDDPFDPEMDADLVCRLFPIDDDGIKTETTGIPAG